MGKKWNLPFAPTQTLESVILFGITNKSLPSAQLVNQVLSSIGFSWPDSNQTELGSNAIIQQNFQR